MTSTLEELAQQVERLEARESIRSLAADYARLLDAKQLEGVAALFTADTIVGAERGRAAKFRSLVRHHGGPGRFGTTIHLVAGHSIDLDPQSPDRATGVVYCRAEHELGDRWVIATIQYWDRYERVNGQWLFAERAVKCYYVVDVLERPNGDPIKQQLTHFGLLESAELPAAWPSWETFWAEQGREPGTPAPSPR